MVTGPLEWRALVNVFTGAVAVIAVEVDIVDILMRGIDLGQDGA